MQVMDEIVSLLEVHTSEKQDRVNKRRQKKTKAELETKVGKEIRDAAMQGMVRREALTDITDLEESTA